MDGTDDRDGPLWRRVLADLEDRVRSGELGDRFPTDRELVEEYDVSRHTVRQAVDHLKARGVIERARGRGSTVARPELVESAGTLYSLFSAVESRGVEQRSEVLVLEREHDVRAARTLGLPPGTGMVRLVRRRLADGEPLALDTVWLPPDLGETLLGVDFTHTSLYGELERRTGLRPTAGEETISAHHADEELREVLALDDDEGVLRIRRVGRVEERVVECRVTLVRGSRFALRSEWPGTGRTSPVLDA